MTRTWWRARGEWALVAAVIGAACGGGAAGGVDAGPPAGPPIEEPACAAATYVAPNRPTPTAAATRPALRVLGRDVVDEAGAPVALRGINLGSWLMVEAWFAGMGPYVNEDAYLDAAKAKARELGVEDRLLDAYAPRAIDWLNGARGRWVIFQELRAAMYADVPADQRAGVDAFWAWADAEPWVFEEESLWRHLEGLHGAAAAGELRDLFGASFVTAPDLARVAGLGLDVVRVPFWYRALEDEAPDGTVTPRPQGWRALDDVVDWARAQGLYVILDLHGAPGGQSAYWHQGLRNGGFLWTKAACVDRTAHLWEQLAAHFQGEPHVAAVDLLNEPDPRGDVAAYERVHQALYQAVRRGDPARIVLAEDGYQGAAKLRSPKEMGWTNAMFSIHAYPGGADAAAYEANIRAEIAAWKPAWDRFDVPLLLGEFSAADPGGGVADVGGARSAFAAEAMARATAALSGLGVHWAPWTFKAASPESYWGLSNPPVARRFDLRGTDLATLRAQFASTRSDGFVVHDDYADALRRAAALPVVPLSFP